MGFRSYPRHLKGRIDGRGYVECARSGFLRKPTNVIEGRHGNVARDKADWTPGFGTLHPQDVPQPTIGGDPYPISKSRGVDMVGASKADLAISDMEILSSIKEGRTPRPGY